MSIPEWNLISVYKCISGTHLCTLFNRLPWRHTLHCVSKVRCSARNFCGWLQNNEFTATGKSPLRFQAGRQQNGRRPRGVHIYCDDFIMIDDYRVDGGGGGCQANEWTAQQRKRSRSTTTADPIDGCCTEAADPKCGALIVAWWWSFWLSCSRSIDRWRQKNGLMHCKETDGRTRV